jgi:hypothetical protein
MRKVTKEYWRGRTKFVDLASCLPLELVYMAAFRSPNPFLRLNRLVRIDRPLKCITETEMRSSIKYINNIYNTNISSNSLPVVLYELIIFFQF